MTSANTGVMLYQLSYMYEAPHWEQGKFIEFTYFYCYIYNKLITNIVVVTLKMGVLSQFLNIEVWNDTSN